MQLSEQQQRAVEHLGTPALVVAGAGSGKTRTLTAKISYLISVGYDPARILAITFTNKAADEMKGRLMQLTGLSTAEFPWVRTFHSACFRILKEHGHRLGYLSPLQIYAGYQQQKVLKEIVVGTFNLDKKLVPTFQAQISNAKNSGDPAGWIDGQSRATRTWLTDVFAAYQAELRARNVVDFDDILLQTRNLLRDHEAVRSAYQQLFDYQLVDEYQDTNNLQEQLTGLLMKNGNLFCVGDDWQAIYSFRGSNIDHFLTFPEKYPGAKVFRLEQNYRSADEIVQVANDLIDFNRHKMDKRCFSDKRGGVVELYAFYDDRQEAHWVGKKIEALARLGIAYDQMAVLYRTKFSSLAFEQTFRAMGISYRMLGGKGFFERKEVLDINCYLTAAMFPKDDVAFERIVNIPKRGIGAGTLAKIAAMKTGAMSLQDAVRKALEEKLLSAKLYDAFKQLIALLDDIGPMRPDAAIREVISRVDYMSYLRTYVQGGGMELTSREENIEQLIHAASQSDSLLEYLEEAALVREDKQDDEQAGFGVNLSTIHAAKGLEFSAVFVVACEEQLFPHWKALESPTGLEEERRLMYVSITRAKQYLYLTSADFRKGQYCKRSRFLDEITEVMS
jgi:DNA helicase-2/ATP-dependent DNA helicase PcrA